jgi:aryl-alcohol dehydrogenase-like predicted oxidoreductase
MGEPSSARGQIGKDPRKGQAAPHAYCLSTAPLGLGLLPLSGGYGPVDERDAISLIHEAIDRGVDFFDTADTYGDGGNESLLGRALGDRRAEVVVATKIGLVEGGRGGVSNDSGYLRAAVEASLRRLAIERIDLLYLHRIDPGVPVEDSVGVLQEFVRAGSVRYLGLCEVTAPEIERAVAVHPIAAVQSEWSVWSRDVERYVVPATKQAGISFVAASPLGRGFLAGRTGAPSPGDQRIHVPRFTADHRAANVPVAREIARLAKAEGMSPAQLSIAWLRESGRRAGVTVVPIPGARTLAHLRENLAAIDLQLATETVEGVDALAARVSGDRGNLAWLSQGRERP